MKKNGFSTLLIVILMGSVAISLVLAISISNYQGVKSGISDKDSSKSKALINACGEISLEAIRENNSFTGTSTVLLDGNNCTYIVSNTGGNNRTIIASGYFDSIFRKIEIHTSAFNPLVISSWQEIQ